MALNPNVDCLLFTGSYETAATLRQLLADRPNMPMVAQTGGKGTAIVLDDAQVEQAVYEVMVGAFLTAGQRHNSTGRAIVTRGVFDRLTDELVKRISQVSIGYGFEDDTFLGPVISENFRTRYRRYGRTLLALRLPSALPFVFGALKINATLALIGAIVAEFFGSPTQGLGFRISTEAAKMNMPLVWGAIVVAAVTGSVVYALLVQLERRAAFWHPSVRAA
jgi:hypothetical protein